MADLRGVSGDTVVNLADGRRVPIRELVGRAQRVWAMSSDGKLKTADSEGVLRAGFTPAIRVAFESGRAIRVTREQPLLGPGGWVTAAQLVPGFRVAMTRSMPAPAAGKRWSDEQLVLLGQLVGDGSYLKGQPLRYATASEANSAAVRAAAEALGATVKRYAGRGRWHQLLISGNGNRWHADGVGKWLKDLGIYGQRSHEKRLPSEVFELSNEQVALLLRHLWATDGSIRPRKPGRKGGHNVHFSTDSPGLAMDVAALLLRFGIVARIGRTVKGTYRPCHCVAISGRTHQRAFLDHVGAFGPSAGPASELRILLDACEPDADLEKAPEQAQAQELFWDHVASVEDEREEEVFTVSVPGEESWLADGIVCRGSLPLAAAASGF